MTRRQRAKRRFLRDCIYLSEIVLSVVVAAAGEQHHMPGLVVVGFALMGVCACRAWAKSR